MLRLPAETRDPALRQKVQSDSEAETASYSIDWPALGGGGRVVLLGGKRAARAFSAKVKNE